MHRIRLIGPWEFSALANADGSAVRLPTDPGRVKTPVCWRTLFGKWNGTAKCSRRFNRPTNIDDVQRIEITIDDLQGQGRILLNEVVLVEAAQGGPISIDVKEKLQPFNQLVMEVTPNCAHESDDGWADRELWSLVAIDIHE